MQTSHPAFAEVIESSLATLTGLCWSSEHVPPFGSIVQITYGPITSYGIITNIVTASSDPSRTPFAFKQTPEELRRNQPQIFAFIQTTCAITLLWHTHEGNRSTLPVPYPAPLHAWIAQAPIKQAVITLTHQELHETLTEKIEPSRVDDCIVALLQQTSSQNALSRSELLSCIEKYSQEINTDVYRAKRFLHHMERILTTRQRT